MTKTIICCILLLISRNLIGEDFKEIGIFNRQKITNMCCNNIPLSKKEFVDAMSKLQDAKELVDKVNDLFMYSRENVECDFCNAAALQISHESLVVDLLQKLMKDESEMISYFIYELDFGNEYKNGMILDEEGNEIRLSSAEELYEYLIKNFCF